MAVENQYNVIKVNELTALDVAQGNDEIIINDVDSTPLETKKITAASFALSIKDYILPIATDTVLGGVKIGEGLTINPVTGVLTNAVLILDDLGDVAILNAEPGQVLRYNGLNWVNESEGGITSIEAGAGLLGGGFTGDIVIDVNAGDGISIKNDQVTFNAGTCLSITNDIVNVNVGGGLTVSNNAIAVVPGVGINISNNSVNFVPGTGLIASGVGIRADIGRGLRFNGNKFECVPGNNLEYDSSEDLSVPNATYDKVGVSKFAPLVDDPADLQNSPSYENDKVNPAFLDKISLVPTGAVFFFAQSLVPKGFLFCDGSVVSITTYYRLYDQIGVRYNDGTEPDGTFRLPDLRDDFIRGANTLTENGRNVGLREDYQTALIEHKHDITQTPYELTGTVGGSVTIPWGAGYTGNYWDPPATKGLYPARPVLGNMTFNLDGATDDEVELTGQLASETENTSIDQETRPRNVALLPCIKF